MGSGEGHRFTNNGRRSQPEAAVNSNIDIVRGCLKSADFLSPSELVLSPGVCGRRSFANMLLVFLSKINFSVIETNQEFKEF